MRGIVGSEFTELTASSNHLGHFGEKDTLLFLNIICYDEVYPKSTYDSTVDKLFSST